MGSLIQKNSNDYNVLLNSVGVLLEKARKEVYYQINQTLVKTYWEIGKRIIEFEQKGEEKAEYGSRLLDRLSQDLKLRYGRGFSRRNVLDMRRFYLYFPKWQTLSAELSWSHYVLILGVSNELAREFYLKQSINDKWSVRELKRQISSMLFERIALSKNKEKALQISRQGLIINCAEDIVKDPYVLEFLKLDNDYKHSEKELEQEIRKLI